MFWRAGGGYASVNSGCAHNPPVISIFFALDGKFPGVGTPELSNPPGWERKKRSNARSSVNTETFFIDSQSNSAVLNILMCNFLFQVTSSFVTGARILIHAATTCTSSWF